MSQPPFIIAEAGVNHDGSIAMAKKLIDVAAEAKADAVKFQTFQAKSLVARHAPKAKYQLETTDRGESQWEMIKRLELPRPAHLVLKGHAQKRGIEFMSTPFDSDSLRFLASTVKVQRLKIPSGELTNGPLLLEAAHSGLPLILSTGMATLGEIENGLKIVAFGLLFPKANPDRQKLAGILSHPRAMARLRERVTILHCVTEYPAPVADSNLRAIHAIQHAFGIPTGYSDHTLGRHAAIAAIALGATLIEKHFTLDKSLPGPDHRASLDPAELALLVAEIREVHAGLQGGLKIPVPSEIKNIAIARKSLVAARAIKKGEPFTADNLTAKRPGTGVSPMEYWEFLGKTAVRDFLEDELIPSAS